MDKRTSIRQLIDSAGAQFCTVTFVKKDSTERTMTIQQRVSSHLAGDLASESHRRGAETRALNNPHLLNVFDVVAKAARSINLDTVTQVSAGGRVYRFA